MAATLRCATKFWILLCISLQSLSGAVFANPANCDDDMTEDQRWTAKLCSAHPGCALVFGIQDSCVKAKSFLSRFGQTGSSRSSSLTDDEVNEALVASGAPRSSLASCLFDLDRTKCSEWLSGGPKPPSAKEKADELAEGLNSPIFNSTREDSAFGLAKLQLQKCTESTNENNTRDAARAKTWCSLAEKGVQGCISLKQRHADLRAQLQSLIGGGSLGPDAARYRTLAITPYPDCPTTLPGSSKTPQVALADYLKWWDTPAKPPAAEANEGVVVLRRGANSGGDGFQQAIRQAEQEERDRPAREAQRIAAATKAKADAEQRERERLAAERRLKAEQERQAPAPQPNQYPVVQQQPATEAPRSGSNPTLNQLVAYCEAEWNVYTDNGYFDITGRRVLVAALKASTEDLRSGAWFTEFRRIRDIAPLEPRMQAFPDCLSRGVLAARAGTFRTPSMNVRAIVDGDSDTRGRQDRGGGVNPRSANQTGSSMATNGLQENLNGEWEGERTGNRVKLQVTSTGIAVARITNNQGQSEPMLYASQGQGSYRINFSGGWSIVETLSTNKIRVRNSDGWNDTFVKRNSRSANQTSSDSGIATGGSSLPAKPPSTSNNPCMRGSYYDGKTCRSGNQDRGYAR
ncbi:MAG: hypothetical protein K9J42_07570 [Sulfuritalea sp.]|nr:hypothetical protein [Sulfuritalea sp.]